MNHDIAHCAHKDCPKSKTCVRYLAYEELKKNPLKYGQNHYFLTIKEKPCKHYLENTKI